MSSARAITVGDANAVRLGRRVRNNALLDVWSASHFAWGVALAILLGPFWAVAILIAWEPFEIFLLGPTLARRGIPFGHETWRNSVSDMLVDIAGAATAFFLVLPFWDPLGIV
jgi:hypothetical protein